MEHSNQLPVYQYFTIINSPENENSDETQSSAENQIVYVAFSPSEDENATDSLLDIKEDEETEDSYSELNSLGPNVKIITLNNGQMFVTTERAINDEGLTAQDVSADCETSDDEQQLQSSINIQDDPLKLEQSDNYEIVELLDEEQSSTFQIYCNNIPSETSTEVRKPKMYKCMHDGCDKAYATPHQLNVHFRVHLNSKPFACTVEGCNKQFSTNYSLKTHVRTHTGEKPYTCVVCEKNFKTSGDLQKHMRTHTGEKPFQCPIEGCGKCFTTSNIRKVHIRSHTGERPYSCPHPNCGKAFSSATNFKNHIRIHSGEKPYVCQVEGCTKRFTEYSSLYKHNMVHQQGRPYTCCFCDQRFKQESAMNLHKRVKHNVFLTNDGTEIVVDLN